MSRKTSAQLDREIAAALQGVPARLSKAVRAKLGVALRRQIKNEAISAGFRRMRHNDYQRAAESAIKTCGLYGRAVAQANDLGVEIFEVVGGAPHVDQGAMVRWQEID